MSKTRKTIVVSGATGQQGGHVARRLLARGHRVRALTRRIDSERARALAELGAELVAADLEHADTLAPALEGADAFFLMTTPFEKGAVIEEVQARASGQMARQREVPHVVYSSVMGARFPTGIEHFEAKGRAEVVLEGMGLPMTIIGAAPFMDNVLAPWHIPLLRQGVFAAPVPRAFPMTQVAVADIAGFAVHAIEHRDQFVGKRIDIASDAVSGNDMHAILSRVLGVELRYEERDFAELDPMLGRLFAGAKPMQGGPPRFDLAALHASYPEVGWHTFEDWARAQDFKDILNREA